VLLVDGGHERGGRREDLIDKDEDGLLGRELDALADHVDELSDGEVGRDEVLLLVDGRDVRLLHLLADDLYGERCQSICSAISELALEGECCRGADGIAGYSPGCGRRTSA
jgi:hypothetical protein